MEKKGLSGIVTIILIILIVLVSIGILWSFTSPVIRNTLGGNNENEDQGEFGRIIGCSELKLEVEECGILDSGNYLVRVERGPGEAEFQKFVFSFKTENEEVPFESDSYFPGEFGSAEYGFNLSSYTNEAAESVKVAAVFSNGNSCGFSASKSCSGVIIGGYCGDETCGPGESQLNCPADCGSSLGLSYCAPKDLTPGNNKSVVDSYQSLKTRYPVGANSGVRSVPTVINMSLNGVNVKVIEFKFRPFEPNYTNAPFTSNWEAQATIIVPDSSIRQINKNALALSMQPGTSGGNPAGSDPIRNISEIPSWYAGTDTGSNFQRTFGSVVTEFNVPMVFYGVVPAGSGRGIEFTSELKTKLNLLAQERSSTYTCDDSACNGFLTEEAAVHGCLNQLSFVGYNDSTTPWPYIDHHPSIFYSIAASRLIDASQGVLNQVAAQANWRDQNNQVYSFNFNTVVAMGGSKRGAAMEKFIVLDPRVKTGLAGHANAGNYLDYQMQRSSLFANSYPSDVYTEEEDQFAFGQITQKWLDYYDPTRWSPDLWIGKTVARSFGSFDTYYAQGAELLFANSMPSETRWLVVPNYGHGFGTVDVAILFRNLVNRTLTGNSDYLKVDAKHYIETETVNATVTGTNNFNDVRVELWCTKGDLDDFIPDRNQWPPTLRNRFSCASLNNDDFDFNPVTPDLRYSHLDKVIMTDFGGGKYSADVNSILGVGWTNSTGTNFIGCYVRAVKGGAQKDSSVATSYLLMNEPLCDSSLLPIKQG